MKSASAKLYGSFRAIHLPPCFSLREPADFHEPIPISERLVQAIWLDQLFDAARLTIHDGRPLRILRPGRWNAEGGPDFCDAQLQIGDETLHGDIEIHLHASGWKDHRHDSDPAYNRVILDVCLWPLDKPDALRTADGKLIPQLALQPHLLCSLEELIESLDPDRYPFAPLRASTRASPLLDVPREELIAYVESAGVFRFEQKTTRAFDLIQQHGPDQAAWQLLAETFGYKHNKLSFQQISLALPLTSLLRKSPGDARIEALLAEGDRRGLRLSQVRPANHPHRRLAALALLLEQHPKPATWFRELLIDPRELRRLPCLEHVFWNWHCARDSDRLAKPLALLGTARWREVVTNAILPFGAAESRLPGHVTEAESVLGIYLKFPCSQSNRAARQIAWDLGIPPPSTTLQQQGLIQMYQDFDLLLPDQKQAMA